MAQPTNQEIAQIRSILADLRYFLIGRLSHYTSACLIAVTDPPALPSVPVVSNGTIGVTPPSRTLINNVLSELYTLVNDSDADAAALSMYEMNTLLVDVAFVVLKSVALIVNVLPVYDVYVHRI